MNANGLEAHRLMANLDRALRVDRPAKRKPTEEERAAEMARANAIAALPVPRLSPEALARFGIQDQEERECDLT